MATDVEFEDGLRTAPLEVIGRLVESSNNALVVQAVLNEETLTAVYKPSAGERPLWDFPDSTLGRRECAAYTLSEHLGWHLVPLTIWRDEGPNGPGMVQRWIDGIEAHRFINLFRPSKVPSDWLTILEGRDAGNEAVVLAHSQSEWLQRLAAFDVLANNADRKAGHLIQTPSAEGERVWAIDHGVTFHRQPKLRTVLWGFAGQPLGEDVGRAIESFLADFSAFGDAVVGDLDSEEVAAVAVRASMLVTSGKFPGPPADGPAVPWPIF